MGCDFINVLFFKILEEVKTFTFKELIYILKISILL